MYTYVRHMSISIKISSLLVLHGPPLCPPWMPSVDRWVHRRPARAAAVPPRRHHLAVRTASAVAPSASEPPRTSRLRRAPDLRPVLYPRPRGRPPPAVGARLPHPILSIRTDGWWMNPKNSAFPATVVDASAWGWPPSPPAGRRRVGPPRGRGQGSPPPSHRTARAPRPPSPRVTERAGTRATLRTPPLGSRRPRLRARTPCASCLSTPPPARRPPRRRHTRAPHPHTRGTVRRRVSVGVCGCASRPPRGGGHGDG